MPENFLICPQSEIPGQPACGQAALKKGQAAVHSRLAKTILKYYITFEKGLYSSHAKLGENILFLTPICTKICTFNISNTNKIKNYRGAF